MASLLKKKNHTVLSTPDSIRQIHVKAITTLTVLTANLIQGDTPLDSILQFYEEPTVENVTRLLVRCKKMYDARVDVKKILHSIIHIEDMLYQLRLRREITLEEQCLQVLRKLES